MSVPRGAFFAVIVFLGLALLICLGGAIGLTLDGDPLPDLLKEVAVGCLAGLTGMLVQHQSDPTPVVVQQPVDQPVPVDTTPTDDQGPTFPGKAVPRPRKRA